MWSSHYLGCQWEAHHSLLPVCAFTWCYSDGCQVTSLSLRIDYLGSRFELKAVEQRQYDIHLTQAK